LNRDSELPANPLFAFKTAKKFEEEKEKTIKDRSLELLKLVAKRRAQEFFQAEVENAGSGAKG
jgi:hypothetical protein